MSAISEILARELGQKLDYIEDFITLLDEGNTIPFIARYRKEMHGAMDDQLIRQIADKLEYLRNLDARREEVRKLIEAQGNLSEEVSAALDKAATLAEIDDIYRPFRPKRKTRASVARERGLEELAMLILFQDQVYEPAIEVQAEGFVDPEKEGPTVQDALQGAMDIIAEDISDSAEYRKKPSHATQKATAP